MTDPLAGAPYGLANWEDFTNNWRKADGDFLQKRSVLRYLTTAARDAALPTPEPGMVIYNAETDRLELRKTAAWAGLYTIDGLIIEPSGADIKLRHPSVGGSLGLVFTSTGSIATQVPIVTAGNELRFESSGLTIKTGTKTAKLTTDATYLRSDVPFLADSLTSTTGLSVGGQSWLTGAVTANSTISALDYITAPRLLVGNASPAAANDATRKDYVDAVANARVYKHGDTMTHYLLIHQANATGGLCLRLRDMYANIPYMDWMNAAGGQLGYIQGSSGGMHMQSYMPTLTLQSPSGRLRTGAGDAILQHDSYGYVQVNSGGIIALSNYSLDFRAYNGWIYLDTNTGYSIRINGAEYGRIGGPASGAQFMWGKTQSGAGYKGCEISPNGPINITTHDAGISQLYLRQMNNANAHGQYYIQFMEHFGSEMGRITRREYPNGIHINNMTSTAASDYRLKNDLGPVSDALGRVMQLRPRHLEWKDGGKKFDGFLAHEVAAVVPEAVIGEKDEVYGDEDAKMAGVEPGSIKEQQLDREALVPLLTAALQELTGRVTALEVSA